MHHRRFTPIFRPIQPLSNSLMASFAVSMLAFPVLLFLLFSNPANAQSALQRLGLNAGQLRALTTQVQNRGSNGFADIASPVDASRNTNNERTTNQNGDGTDQIGEAGLSGQKNRARRGIAHPLSPMEREYSERTGSVLRQYGYNMIVGSNTQNFTGGLGDDYILGIGDELIITMIGQPSQTITTRVDTEGRVLIPEFPPIPAADRNFGEFREDLSKRIQEARLGTAVYVSIGKIRSISVVVVGEVYRPGVVRATSLSSILDVLSSAGGIKKSGSLRNISVIRGAQRLRFDAYSLLGIDGANTILRIKQGDRVVVPTLGATIGITGDVNRPGIYEIANHKGIASAQWALKQAGHTIRPQGNRIMRGHQRADGSEKFTAVIGAHQKTTLTNGDLLVVQKLGGAQAGTVRLEGHVRHPGLRTLDQTPTIKQLLARTDVLEDDPYFLFGIVSRIDPYTRSRSIIAISLANILNSDDDFILQKEDKIVVLGWQDILFLGSSSVRNVLHRRQITESRLENVTEKSDRSTTGTASTSELRQQSGGGLSTSCAGLRELAIVLNSESPVRFTSALRALEEGYGSAVSNDLACPPIFQKYPVLLPFLLEHVVAITGEVRQPGAYPIADATALPRLLGIGGGLTRDANPDGLEISRSVISKTEGRYKLERHRISLTEAKNWIAKAGDIIKVAPILPDVEGRPVLLAGEFLRPGFYNITRGENLSEVISRAGGLTEQAYPYGAVFTRERLKTGEKAWLERRYQELQETIVAASTRASRRNSAAGGGMVDALKLVAQSLLSIKPIGRMVIEADPAVLEVKPERNIVMQPGDRIYMPKRPSHVRVEGEVLNPGAIAFNSGSKAEEYIRDAGGLKHAADDERTFVVFPDGRAEPLKLASWNYSATQIPPGSTIFIPRDPLPFDGIGFTIDITDILSKIAITAASIATINR